MVEVIGCDLLPWAIGDSSGKHLLRQWRGLVPCAYGAPVYIVIDVQVNTLFPWPVVASFQSPGGLCGCQQGCG